jgi:RNA polymerase sigma factor (TIGR02999 family)
MPDGFDSPWRALETSANPFAAVVLAHAHAVATRDDPPTRRQLKLGLVKGLCAWGWAEEDMREPCGWIRKQSKRWRWVSAAGILRQADARVCLLVVPPMTDVTRILSAMEHGDPHAAAQLLPLVYDELRELAAHRLAHEKPGQTLQATALVHEAYVRLVAGPAAAGGEPWKGRGHFFGAAAEAMRRILVESARRKSRLKHGGEHHRVDLESDCLVSEAPSLDVLALDEALTKLAREEPLKAELVKLRFFAGLTMPEAAAALDISLATAERAWIFAKAWLYAEIAE